MVTRERPSDVAVAAAAFASKEFAVGGLQLRFGFLDPERRSGTYRAPMASLLSQTGGRDAVRLKLALALTWMAGGNSPTLEAPAYFYADLLDLDDAKTNGARRIRAGLTALQKLKLVELSEQRPQPTAVTVLREDGSRRPYTRPTGSDDLYIAIPAQFFTEGWMSTLGGPAITAWLILRANQPFTGPNRHLLWLARSRVTSYGISRDTWETGTQELERRGLIERDVQNRPALVGNTADPTSRAQLYRAGSALRSRAPGSGNFRRRVTITVHEDRLLTSPEPPTG